MTPLRARWLAALAVCIGLVVFFSLQVFPWWNAGTSPVVLRMYAPADATIEIGFEESGSETLRLVPIDPEPNGYAWTWTTELPPRPEYDIRFVFPRGLRPSAFADLTLWRISPQKEPVWSLEAEDVQSVFSFEGARYKHDGKRWLVTADAGASMTLLQPIDLRPALFSASWFYGNLNLLLGAGLLACLFFAGLRFPSRLERPADDPWDRGQWALLILLMVASAGLHIILVRASIADYWPADSTSYMMKTVTLLDNGSYDSGTHEYELNRMPGFPLFMALAFKLFGWNLDGVILLQAVFFCLAAALLILSLRPYLEPWIVLVASPLAFVSPPLVWASRQIATESTFASFWVLGIAAFIRFLDARSRRGRALALVAFTFAALGAVYVRPNGILLMCLPGCWMVSHVWRALREHGVSALRQAPVWLRVAVGVAPMIVVIVGLALWSYRNQLSRGYPHATDLMPIVLANQPFNAGMLDLRALDDAKEYDYVVKTRYNVNYWFHGWSLRNYRFRRITNEYTEITDASIGQLDTELRRFVERNADRIPWQARVMATWRVLGWGLWFPGGHAFTPDPHMAEYLVTTKVEKESIARKIANNLKWAARQSENTITHPAKEPSPVIDTYNKVVPSYPYYYRTLAVLGLMAFLFALRQRNGAALCLLIPYWLNLALNVYLLFILGRYVQVLDLTLLLGVLLALTGRLLPDEARAPHASVS